jgi:hypothetical protein
MKVHCWCSKYEQKLAGAATVYSTTKTHSVAYRGTLTKLFMALGDNIASFFNNMLDDFLVCFFPSIVSTNIMRSLHCHPCNQGETTHLRFIVAPKQHHRRLERLLVWLDLAGGVYHRHPHRSQQVCRLRYQAYRQDPSGRRPF